MKHLPLILILAISGSLQAQIAFERGGHQYTEGFRSGVAVMITDINGDMRDDLVRFRDGVTMEIWLQAGQGQWFQTYSYTIPGAPQWNITGADVDNDGWTDIVTSGSFDHVKVFHQEPFSHSFTRTTLAATPFFAQGSNLVDINNDGHLDIFVCNDVAENFIFINDSTGQFERRNDIIDFTTEPPSDMSGNYGSVWSDFDSDGDLDLYIAKCRVGVGDPTDPRRVNALFVNDNGTFTNMAAEYGVATGRQSWAADFADFDNDGDMDLFVANHDAESILYENIDNTHFEDVTASAGISVGGLAIQSVFCDFDNDGWIDLLIGGTQTYLFRNNGDKTFSSVASPFSGRPVVSYALGDLNSDGFTDVYAIYNELYNEPDDVNDDAIFLNKTNDNNYIRVVLKGNSCNANAIGTRLQIFGTWGVQMREVEAGESYGITNSPAVIFGLGQAEQIDSLRIIWPHGLVETYDTPPVNSTVRIEEGGCLTELKRLEQGPFVQCADETFAMYVPEGYNAYLWGSGQETDTIVANVPGVYHVSVEDSEGCITVAGSVHIAENMEPSDVQITVYGRDIICHGDSIILEAPEGLSYLWNTGSEDKEVVVSSEGAYQVTVARHCSEVTAGPLQITVLEPEDFTFIPDTIIGPGVGLLTATGDSVNWYAHPDDAVPLFSGEEFETPFLDMTRLFYVENVNTIPGLSFAIGMAGHAGTTLYNADQFNGALLFDASARFRLDSVLVITDFPGQRTIQILDEGEEVYYERSFDIAEGSSYLPLDVWIEEGESYRITTDADTNNYVFGTASPQLVRSSAQVDFPYTVDDVMSITMTAFDQNFYYYFYDWHITASDMYCISMRHPVEVVVDTTSGTSDYEQIDDITLFPNPANDVLHVRVPSGVRISSHAVFDVNGKPVRSSTLQTPSHIDVGHLPPGVYFVRLGVQGRQVTCRFIKTR